MLPEHACFAARPVATRACGQPFLAPFAAAELATKAEEVASLHEAQRSAQSQIAIYISDLQVRGLCAGWEPGLPAERPAEGWLAGDSMRRPGWVVLCVRSPMDGAEHPRVLHDLAAVLGVSGKGLRAPAALQAYERQAEALGRAMNRGDEAAEGLDRERQALLEQLRGAEQARLCLGT